MITLIKIYKESTELYKLIKDATPYHVCKDLHINYHNYMNKKSSRDTTKEVNDEIKKRIINIADNIKKEKDF